MSWIDRAKLMSDLFWSKVVKEPGDGCWIWTAGRNEDGYGKFSITMPAVEGRNPQIHRTAHRVAYALVHGHVPPLLRHRCDNPPCCNPAHLEGGTQKDNLADCVRRGRHPRGEKSAKSKLTELQAREVLSMRGSNAAETARRFGISKPTVYAIWSGRIWSHLS